MSVDTTNAFNFNRYAYANNSPYKFTDPDGRIAWAMIGAPVAAAALLYVGYHVATHPIGNSTAGQSDGLSGLLGSSDTLPFYTPVLNEATKPEGQTGDAPVDAPKNEKEAGERIKELVGDKPTTGTVKELGEKGWGWRSKPGEAPGSSKGAFVNPKTGEQVHNDLDSHKSGTDRGPHVTYTDTDGNRWDYFPETETTVKQ